MLKYVHKFEYLYLSHFELTECTLLNKYEFIKKLQNIFKICIFFLKAFLKCVAWWWRWLIDSELNVAKSKSHGQQNLNKYAYTCNSIFKQKQTGKIEYYNFYSSLYKNHIQHTINHKNYKHE